MPRHRVIQFDADGHSYLDYTDEEKARRERRRPIDDEPDDHATDQRRRNANFDF